MTTGDGVVALQLAEGFQKAWDGTQQEADHAKDRAHAKVEADGCGADSFSTAPTCR